MVSPFDCYTLYVSFNVFLSLFFSISESFMPEPQPIVYTYRLVLPHHYPPHGALSVSVETQRHVELTEADMAVHSNTLKTIPPA